MLRKRIITALWGIPLLVVAIWFDEPIPWFTVFACIWGLLAVYEFYSITGVSRIVPVTVFGIIWTGLFIIRPHINVDIYYPLLLISMAIFPMFYLLLYRSRKRIFSTWFWTIIGIIYVGLLLSFLVDLRLAAGRNWVFLTILVTFASDTLAYFTGRAFGRHLLAQRISPHKTWEGAITGVAGAIGASFIFTISWPLQLPIDYSQAVLLGVLISVFGQLGDLLESGLKRYTGVKDSGTLMPGHGGLLDRMDSIVIAGVVVYLYYIIAIA
jgi:phosphatidate cytidylyltransferase